MTEVIPAILPKGISEIRTQVSRVKDSVKFVQIDFCDGVFVGTRTWPYNGKSEEAYAEILKENEGMPYWEEVDYEFDLMVKNASKHFDDIVKLGPARVIFHIEAEDNLLDFFEKLDPYFKSTLDFGIAIDTTTDTEILKPFLQHIKFIQCMGIAIDGKQHQPFDNRVLSQIKKIKEFAPNMIISVDGSVNKETAPYLIEAGVTRLVIGSALFNEVDIMSAISDFEML